jgi:hypothetical protein
MFWKCPKQTMAKPAMFWKCPKQTMAKPAKFKLHEIMIVGLKLDSNNFII